MGRFLRHSVYFEGQKSFFVPPSCTQRLMLGSVVRWVALCLSVKVTQAWYVCWMRTKVIQSWTWTLTTTLSTATVETTTSSPLFDFSPSRTGSTDATVTNRSNSTTPRSFVTHPHIRSVQAYSYKGHQKNKSPITIHLFISVDIGEDQEEDIGLLIDRKVRRDGAHPFWSLIESVSVRPY